ncbi:M3 family metallopeptidase [Gallaecimonas mangrovi]|uniref:M3 family metallopeptidase n=1 Tax=Gallaecimonas mangrovi TaxID=2291597 RepID=UPI000E200496|nr:M3 family metallopeptidase [Gallaecimonas mangrovi]
MRKTLIATAIGAALALSACSDDPKAEHQAAPAKEQSAMSADHENVLMHKSTLQYQAPEFDKITVDDYLPAFKKGMQEHSAEIKAIADNSAAPTFENTIVAMEKSGTLLNRVSTVFGNLSGLVSNKQYQDIEAEMAPKLAAHSDSIYLNPTLFARIETIYKNKASLSKEDQRLTDFYYNNFVRAGAKLSAQDKAKIGEINGELAKLTSQFTTNILQSFKNETILVKDKSELAGLSDDEIASLAAAAKDAGKDGYMITLVNTTRQPILQHLDNRELRKKIWETSAHRAQDNGPVLLKLVELRAEKAKLLGYPTWAAYVLEDQMAKTPDAVFDILDKLAPKAVAKAKSEAADIQAEIKKDGGDFKLQPWDWAYYAEKVRKAKYDLDESQVKPYFEFNNVLHDGLFYAMHKLYGITFKERKDLPVWNKDVMPFEVFDADGKSIGLFYEDPYARTGKSGGAWMSEWVTQSGLLGNHPVIYNALNIPKPAPGQPTLLTFDEVTTMFHEFGHALHGMFSDVKYPSLAGTNTPRDFVEFPSQFNEDWDINPEVISHYAKNYKTGAPIPKELLDKVLAAHKFNMGFDTTEYLGAALLDMEWHSIPAGTKIDDIDAFEHKALAKHGIDYAPVPPRYKSRYFSHIFSGGYSAGYYAYLWTEVFAADAFQYMKDNGGLTRENGDKFRKDVLSKGNSQDLMEDYIKFRGQKPTIDALLKRRGLVN